MLHRLVQAFLITHHFFQFQILESVEARAREKNSFIEYCSVDFAGTEKICRDAQAMKDFNEKELRLHGAFITYNSAKKYEGIIFGWGECMSRPNGSYVKLLPSAMWQRAPDDPFLVLISETIDLFTTYADQEAQISLSEGKSHVIILNGELRSFRSDVRRRCVAHTPSLRGVNHYHFSKKEGDTFMARYELSPKDKIFLGKEEMKECAEYATMDTKRDIFLKKTEPDIIPTHFETCAMQCSREDMGIIRARNGTGGGSIAVDEDASLPGILVMYAMNETESGHRENRLYRPTFRGMLTSMYDTEVTPHEHEHLSYAATHGRGDRAPEERSEPISSRGRARRSVPRAHRGKSVDEQRRTRRDDDSWLLEEVVKNGDENDNSGDPRRKRLTYSSAVFMANTVSRPQEESQDELRCVS